MSIFLSKTHSREEGFDAFYLTCRERVCDLEFLMVAALLGVSCAFQPSIALAQDSTLPQGFDPPVIAPDHNGVDLMSGHIIFPSPRLQIAAVPRLSFSNINKLNIFLKATKNIIQEGPITASLHYNKGEGESESFLCNSDDATTDSNAIPCFSEAPLPSYAKGPGGKTFYEAKTGRRISFGALYDMIPTGAQCWNGVCSYTALSQSSASIWYASSISYPDGEILNITYDTQNITTAFPATGPNGGAPTGNVVAFLPRPSKITSNRGFELDITYQSNNLNVNSATESLLWFTPSKISIYAIGDYTKPLASIAVSAADGNLIQSVTDMSGNVWTGSFGQIWGQSTTKWSGQITPPSGSAQSISASSSACGSSLIGYGASAYMASSQLVTSVSKGGDVWTYSYSNGVSLSQCGQSNTPLANASRSVTINGPNGYSRVVYINQPDRQKPPSITQDVDSLGRSTTYVYSPLTGPNGESYGQVMTEIHFPEGNNEVFSYDSMGNMTQLQRVPKPGSGLSTVVLQAGFPQDTRCYPWKFTLQNGVMSPPPITCMRPLWTKDANGNQTDYTWDSDTGMLLTQTDPANVSGIRPQVRYGYAQRYAWWGDGNGGYVKAATPIWVKTSESRCQNSSATGNSLSPCAGNDEVLTTYDFGPDAGPNYLLVKGVAISANGITVRTCYGYDAAGNKISETRPNGAGGACP